MDMLDHKVSTSSCVSQSVAAFVENLATRRDWLYMTSVCVDHVVVAGVDTGESAKRDAARPTSGALFIRRQRSVILSFGKY